MRPRSAGVKQYFWRRSGIRPDPPPPAGSERSAHPWACGSGAKPRLEPWTGAPIARPQAVREAPDSGGRTDVVTSPRRVLVRTYGCQMNAHDSEKIESLLLHEGWTLAADLEEASLLIVNTCSIRDKAEHQLYSDLGALRAWREAVPGRTLAVGGCVAQQEGGAILRRFPQVDFVFGTHNLRFVPELADAALRGLRQARVAESRSLERFELPERHPEAGRASAGRAFVTVMEGCDLFCSFCIVPQTRGREISRPAASILDEARALAARGVREITLLGQTVNAYGRHDRRLGRSQASGTLPFARLLAQLAAIPGLARLRYTSPHPIFFDAELLRAH